MTLIITHPDLGCFVCGQALRADIDDGQLRSHCARRAPARTRRCQKTRALTGSLFHLPLHKRTSAGRRPTRMQQNHGGMVVPHVPR